MTAAKKNATTAAAKPAPAAKSNDDAATKKAEEANTATDTTAKVKDAGTENATAPAAARKSASASKGTDQVSLPKGKGTQATESIGGPAPIPRSDDKEQDPGITDGKEDTIRRQADKARWEYGKNDTDTATLLSEQREIDRNSK